MKRKSSIITLSVLGAAIIIGFVLAFCPMQIGLKNFNSFAGSIKLGLDLKGGVYAVYEAEANEDGVNFNTAMSDTITSLQTTLTGKGYTEAVVQKEGSNRIRVSVPDVDDPQDILSILGNPAQIKFVLNGENGDSTIFTGREVTTATAGYNDNKWGVSLKLNDKGKQAFADATSNNVGRTITIYSIIDGVENIVSTATIQEAIVNGETFISGSFTQKSAQRMAEQITAGKLGLKLTQKEVSTIAATLGENALKYGLIAGAIGILLVIGLMIWKYRLFGVAAGIALLSYTVLILFVLSVFPWVQLTLPGIAGILLSIGMAIDGNVIINERIKDEFRSEKTIKTSVHYGYRKSRSSIADGNITTIIAAVVLLIFGTGPIQGFAITLMIGIVLALASSLLITPLLIRCMIAFNDSDPKLFNLTRLDGQAVTTTSETSTPVAQSPEGGIA